CPLLAILYNYSTFYPMHEKDMCGGVLTGLSGVIASPGYPEDYSNNADCSWSIHVSNVSVVTLVFWDFQLENNEGCNFDFVAVFDGPTVSHRHLGKYCGVDKPPNIVTTSNQLLVVFKSDFNIGGRGFTASYLGGNCSSMVCLTLLLSKTRKCSHLKVDSCNKGWGQLHFSVANTISIIPVHYNSIMITVTNIFSNFFYPQIKLQLRSQSLKCTEINNLNKS
uniref:CUB domain containing protein 2 n=1 Tax=Gouania willdenowi TaxID=441366 RepID=A0A8C5NH10_GOUWI